MHVKYDKGGGQLTSKRINTGRAREGKKARMVNKNYCATHIVSKGLEGGSNGFPQKGEAKEIFKFPENTGKHSN